MLNAMNLCLSNVCPGRCIYCPTDRGDRPGPAHMPLEVAARCIEQAAANGIRCFSVSENGEALANPDALPILRLLRRTIPDARVAMFSNFALMTADIAATLLGENLVGAFFLNIDGLETYQAVKGLNYENLAQNLRGFLRIRGSRRIPLSIRTLSRARYRAAMRQLFGLTPQFAPEQDGPDETNLVRETWLPLLTPGLDDILASPAIGWARRDRWRIL